LLPFGILCLDGVRQIFVPVGNETRKQENDPCRHTGRTIVITGASSGFGAAAVRAFADRGDRVWGTMRDTAGRNAAKKAELEGYSPRIAIAEMDVTSDASVADGFARILAEGPSTS
jgi:NAD(P)-dependent dehydrogenase (short-subunit alcohol dehydrogenase family)